MKKFLLTAMVAAASLVGAGEEYEFDKVSDWLPSKGVTQIDDGLLVKNRVMLRSKKLFDVKPGKIYKLKLEAKRVDGVPTMIYFGFETYLANGKTPVSNEHVNAIYGTLSSFAKDAKKGDTVIYLDNTAAKWKKLGHSFFAIDAKKDFSDLPNYKIIRAPITNIEKCAEGYKITLGVKMPRDIAKGTTVRQHISGGYMYAGGYKLLKDQEVKLSGKVIDTLPKGPGYAFNKWTSYAGKARLIVLVNWTGKGSTTALKDIELEIEDKK